MLASERKKGVCATLLSYINAKPLFDNLIQKFEDTDEVGFARAVWSYEHVQFC